jgi:hypothetical protein
MAKMTKSDGKWLLGIGVVWLSGLIGLFNLNMENLPTVYHLKIIYGLFLTLAIFISAYYIVFKLEDRKKNGKK